MDRREELRVKIDEWFESHSDEMINDLGKLVEINSVKGKCESSAPFGLNSRAALTTAQSMLEAHGFEVSIFEDIMLTALLGPAPPLMGILAHLDIVETGEGWDTDPLKTTVKDGIIYGRGVIDNKGPAVAAMYAMYCARDICPELAHGVQLLLGTEEETGMSDVKKYLEKNKTPPNVFSPDAEYPVVNIEKGRFLPVFGAKWDKDTKLPRVISITGGKTPNIVPNRAQAVIEGVTIDDAGDFCREYSKSTGVSFSAIAEGDTITITAEGLAAHASTPERGNNAQTALIKMLAAMPFANSKGFECIRALSRLFPHGDNHGTALGIDMSDEIVGRITVNFGVLRFSELEFSGNFDSRTPSCADDLDLTAMTRAALEREAIELTYSEVIKSHHTPEDSPFVQTLLNIYEEFTGEQGKCLSMGGLTYVHDIPGGVAFGCAMPDEENNVHGANEFISLEQLIKSAKMFTLAIVDMCTGE